MILYSDLALDGRVRREASALSAAGCEVRLACLDGDSVADDMPAGVRALECRPWGPSPLTGVESRATLAAAPRTRRAMGTFRWVIDYLRSLRSWGRAAVDLCGDVDAWHVHDLTGLVAIAPELAADRPVIYDSHELFTETGFVGRLPWVARALIRKYERRLIRRTSALVTVNESVARVMVRRYDPERVVIVYNALPKWDPSRREASRLHNAVGLHPSNRVVLYHGAFGPGRGISQVAEAMLEPGLRETHLVFVGFGPYMAQVADLVRDPRFGGRVHVLPSVLPDQLPGLISSADVGVVAMQPTTMNLRLSTPNKLFECIGAGVPVVVSDFAEMRAIVREGPWGPLGETCNPESPASIAAALRRILELDHASYAVLRERCRTAAQQRWNWESESAKLIALYADVVVAAAGAQLVTTDG